MRTYITFEEALKESANGKTIYSWLDNEELPYNIHYQSYDQLNENLRLDKFKLIGDEMNRFREVKWTLEK